jgi:ubiquinone/menaquinone biosynthesis C-methylase UbiE
MKNRWNARSRTNAAHAIADYQADWPDLEVFFATGRDDVDRLIELSGWEQTCSMRLLEIGCGTGRMTRHLATRFREVVGLDVSGEMIRQANELHPHLPNASFVEGTGVDLSLFPDQSFDAVLSYIVFQHIPSRQIIYHYVEEALRVLRPTGSFLFQARNDQPLGNTGTYQGDRVELEEIQRIARGNSREITVVKGRGEQYCYILIHPASE